LSPLWSASKVTGSLHTGQTNIPNKSGEIAIDFLCRVFCWDSSTARKFRATAQALKMKEQFRTREKKGFNTKTTESRETPRSSSPCFVYKPLDARNSRTTVETSRWSASTWRFMPRISVSEIFPPSSARAARNCGNFSSVARRTIGTASYGGK
jgi:hypothetical protein